MKLTIPLQSLINPEYSRFTNICSRVRAAFLQLDETQRLEILVYLYGENLEYVDRVLPFHAITRSVVTEISRMMCQIQDRPFEGLSPYQNDTWYPSIEMGLNFNNVQYEEFFGMDLDERDDPSLNRTALLQYMIDNGQNVLTVEIQK